MDVIHKELSLGNDNTLLQILSEWSKRYEEKYAEFSNGFFGFITEKNERFNNNRPKSADVNKPTYQGMI